MDTTIPRRIIHVGPRDLSPVCEAAILNVKLLNPDFEYLFFDDAGIEEFTNQYFPEYEGVLNSFRVPIQRFDFFRYLAVYHYGGFYLDLDVLLVSGLTDLLSLRCVFPFEEITIYRFLRREYGMDWGIGNYAFGAAPGHPFVEAIIRNCVRAQKDQEWVNTMTRSIPRILGDEYYVLCSTGPGLVSRTLAEYPDAGNQVKVLFPEDVCDRRNWNRFGRYGVHLCIGSWRKKPLNIQQHFVRFIRGKLFEGLQEREMKLSRDKGPKRSL